MNTTISISKNKFVAMCIVLVMLLLAVFVLLLKPEKRQEVVFRGIAGGEPLLEAIGSKGIIHTLIGFDAEGRMRGFRADTGDAINVCDASAGEKSNTLTGNESCELSPEMVQQLAGCPGYCPTKCDNGFGALVCAHVVSGKKYRGCHNTNPPAPQNHAQCQ